MKLELTFDEALKMVPEYVLLVPCVDVWQKGDAAYNHLSEKWEGYGVMPGVMVSRFDAPGRRAIPNYVREAMARMVLYASNEMAKYDGESLIVGNWISGRNS